MLPKIPWEIVSAIAGVICALPVLLGPTSLFNTRKQEVQHPWKIRLNYFLLFCSGWFLTVIAFNWLFEPFGAFLTTHDEKKLYACMFGVPAALLTCYGYRGLVKKTNDQTTPTGQQADKKPGERKNKYEFTKEPPEPI